MNKAELKNIFYSLRPAQWIKNLFLFIPLIFGKKLLAYPANIKTVLAFFIFCLAASVVYLINDIIDIDKDKVHPTKRLRPIALGKISIFKASLSALILGVISVSLSFALNLYFGVVVAAYLAGNILYSMALKNVVIIDVFCIAVFFYLRIKAGSVIAMVDLSHWIIFMIILLAFFLGINKRRQELKLLEKESDTHRIVLNEYTPYFIDQMTSVITASIVIVYTLYTVDARTTREFGSDHLIYSIPFVYYGIFRYLYMIHKVRNDGDPTRILFSDQMMRINIILWITVCIAVIYFGL